MHDTPRAGHWPGWRVATGVLLWAGVGGCATNPMVGHESLGELGDRLARTLCAGSPARVEHVPNPHVDGQVDRRETRRCAAGRSTLYLGASTSDPNGLPVAAEVVEPGAGLPAHLEIGASIGDAMQALGVPQAQAIGSVTYDLGMEGNDQATIRHAAGRITSVQWTWVVD